MALLKTHLAFSTFEAVRSQTLIWGNGFLGPLCLYPCCENIKIAGIYDDLWMFPKKLYLSSYWFPYPLDVASTHLSWPVWISAQLPSWKPCSACCFLGGTRMPQMVGYFTSWILWFIANIYLYIVKWALASQWTHQFWPSIKLRCKVLTVVEKWRNSSEGLILKTHPDLPL